jgi:lysyl-tRNA synthetase class I
MDDVAGIIGDDMAGSVQLTWQADWAYRWMMWKGIGDQLGSDTCHPCSGHTCHVRMDGMAGL